MRTPSHARRSRRQNTTLPERFIEFGVYIPANPAAQAPMRLALRCTCEDDANPDGRTHMARDKDRRQQCSRIRRIILPALALSGALALAGCAIRTSDLGSTSECADFNPATEPCPLSP